VYEAAEFETHPSAILIPLSLFAWDPPISRPHPSLSLSLCAWDPLLFFLSHACAVVVGGASSSGRRAWRGNVVTGRPGQSTVAAVWAIVHRHLHYSSHHLLALHTPPPPAIPCPTTGRRRRLPISDIHPSASPLCLHLAAHCLTSCPLPFLQRCLCVRLLGRPEIHRNPCELSHCCRRQQWDLSGPRASSTWLGLGGAGNGSGISAKRSEGGWISTR
jgi:hypothetical protein